MSRFAIPADAGKDRSLPHGHPIELLESRTLLATAPPTLLRDPSSAFAIAEAGGQRFFAESDHSLYVTNGTAGGTFKLRDFVRIGNFVGAGDLLYFTTETGVWRSDGTPAGTMLVLPIAVSSVDAALAHSFTELGGTVFFYANNPGVGSGLWKTDGTPQGTTFIKSVPAEALTAAGDTLYFIGGDSLGKELWKSDGTEAGTVMVRDVYPGSNGSMTFLADRGPMAPIGGSLLFMANDGTGSYGLWRTDGTEAGTVKLTTSAVQLYGDLTVVGGAVYFSATDAAQNQEIWKSDGTAAGTMLVKELGPGQTTGFADRAWQLMEVNGTLFFAARNGFRSANLWRSDGTADGTVP